MTSEIKTNFSGRKVFHIGKNNMVGDWVELFIFQKKFEDFDVILGNLKKL